MKNLKNLTIFIILFTVISCGTSERIITDDGKIYEVKGNTIKNNGIDVTEDLSADEKKTINDRLEEKQKLQSKAEEEQKELEIAIENQEKIEEKAKANQRELKARLEALQDRLKATKNAKDEYVQLKKNYIESQKELEKLKNKGELSPNEIKAWEEKLAKQKLELDEAQKKIDIINKIK